MLRELGHIEGEDGDNTNFEFSRLDKIISCACGHFTHFPWSIFGTTR
jgi:hypothetical protein